MCKTYDAIYELAKHMESNILICELSDIRIEGELHKCDCIANDCKCYESVVTLKDAIITCKRQNEIKEMKWVNVASKHIQAFAFKCCEK